MNMPVVPDDVFELQQIVVELFKDLAGKEFFIKTEEKCFDITPTMQQIFNKLVNRISLAMPCEVYVALHHSLNEDDHCDDDILFENDGCYIPYCRWYTQLDFVTQGQSHFIPFSSPDFVDKFVDILGHYMSVMHSEWPVELRFEHDYNWRLVARN